jgi:DNA-binding MarR family transcriptional regulator
MPQDQAPEGLSQDLLAILSIVKERGGTDCSGSCHHRRPGEFHCHTVGQMLNISSSGMKERILRLVQMGLMERQRVEKKGEFPLTKFLVTEQGEKVLAAASPVAEENQ